jgi:4-hydroxy-2-oxoheptanedioate aldolase
MRSSKVKAKLRKNEPVLFTTMHFAHPAEYEMTSLMGFDGLWMDLEHHRETVETADDLIRAARVGNADVMVRPAKGEFLRIGRILEAGATGIMYPRCDDAAEAKELVKWSKFAPMGRRGADGANADMPYLSMPIGEYIKKANEETFLVVQIEDQDALKNAEAIAAVDGVDVLFFGPGDFSILSGIPGQFDNKIIDDAINAVAKAAKNTGKHWGMPAFNVEWAKKLLDRGARFLAHGSDINFVKNALTDIRTKFGPLGFTFDARF